MDPTGLQPFLEAGPWGISALLLAAVIWQNKKIDDIRLQQISDVKLALEVVSKSTDNLASAEQRMSENNAAMKDWLAVSRSQQAKG